mmetsp:Transcript_82545/g.172824  ORF Transcript_82545/g.172824 Transcript_82545/m.172824 type:complete len:89 (-) Transcript_82545:91-357(-)
MIPTSNTLLLHIVAICHKTKPAESRGGCAKHSSSCQRWSSYAALTGPSAEKKFEDRKNWGKNPRYKKKSETGPRPARGCVADNKTSAR